MELEERTYLPETAECLFYCGFSRDFWNDLSISPRKIVACERKTCFRATQILTEGLELGAEQWCLENSTSRPTTS